MKPFSRQFVKFPRLLEILSPENSQPQGGMGVKKRLLIFFWAVHNISLTLVWCMVWCLFIQHQCTSYIAQITQDAEREMHEV